MKLFNQLQDLSLCNRLVTHAVLNSYYCLINILSFGRFVMAEALPNQSEVDSQIATLSALIKLHSKRKPPCLEFDRLASSYNQAQGNFSKHRLGKFKQFVVRHFCYDNSKDIVYAQKKEGTVLRDQKGDLLHCPSNPSENNSGTKGKEQTVCNLSALAATTVTTADLAVKGMQFLFAKQNCALSVYYIIFLNSFLVSQDKSHTNESTDQETTASARMGPSLEVMDTLTEFRDKQSEDMAVTTQRLLDIVEMVKPLFEKLLTEPKRVLQIQDEADKLPNWDEWQKMKFECMSFDRSKAQFVLVAGRVPPSEIQHVGLVRKVKWHSIIDLDPDSETNGLFRAFSGEKQSHSEMWTPHRISEFRISELASTINFLQPPWLFARGRTKDSQANKPRKSFQDWSEKWMGHIGRFLTVVAENLDRHRPVVTLILPFDGKMNNYISTIFSRFHQELSSLPPSYAKHVVLTTGGEPEIDLNIHNHVQQFQIPAILFSFGLAVCLGCSPEHSKTLPSRVSGAPVPLTESDFSYFSEYLTLLYDGCENEEFGENPDCISHKQRIEIIERHREAFLSGQTISFISLSNEHDATRDDLAELCANLRRYMIQPRVPPSSVIEVVQQPGTGGSTLARRTLWNLRQEFPCAIVNSNLSVSSQDEEDASVDVESVCKRIKDLEDLCFAPPLVLVDGETSAFRRPHLARAIAKKLASRGSKAVILHCVRVADSTNPVTKPSRYGIKLKSKLSNHERDRFREKYHSSHLTASEMSSFTRSHHFPLYAFLEEFREKMKGIVARIVDELNEVETAIIRFVALMQKYAAQSVPLSLIFDLFLKEMWTDPAASSDGDNDFIPIYDAIYSSFTDDLRVLLVQSGNRRIRDEIYGMCNLQHVSVAEIVLKKLFGDSKYYEILNQYLNELIGIGNLKAVARNHGQLFEDLLLHNKGNNPKLSFSVLVEELKRKLASNEVVGKLLESAASVFPSPRFYSHVARYYLYSKPRNFSLAQQMVTTGFRCKRSNESDLILHEMNGLIGRIRLSDMVDNETISSIQQLESLASKALEDYSSAITSPPSKPDPLVGKVQVWIKCLEWIEKVQCDGRVVNVLRYLSTEAREFFRNIISDAFYHLELIENVVAAHTVHNEDYTLMKVNECKDQLLFVKAKSRARTGNRMPHRHTNQLVAECEQLSRDSTLASFSTVELKRLKVHYFLNRSENEVKLEQLKPDEIRYLYHLLRELVNEDEEYIFVLKLFRVATYLPPDASLSLDEAIRIVRAWQSNSPFDDPYVHFCFYVLYFLKVLYGSGVEYGAKYEAALKKCLEKSRSFNNRLKKIFYLGQGTSDSGLSVLRERAAGISSLVDGETAKNGNEDYFWQQTSRKTLQELEGRIKRKDRGIYSRHRNNMQNPAVFFELVKNGLHIDAGRNQMHQVGDLGRDYEIDQLAKFVVGFNLRGPQAHGIVV